MSINCNICDKNYKSRQSLWNHNKKYHSELSTQLDVIKPNINRIKKVKDTQNFLQEKTKSKTTRYQCQYCADFLSSNYNLKRHHTTCFAKDDFMAENGLIEISNQNKREILIDKIKQHHTDDILDSFINMLNNKKEATNSTTTHSHNNYSNNTNTHNKHSHNTTNNHSHNNNNNTNINIQLVALGKENLIDVLPQNEQIEILKQRCLALESLIKHVHFNDKYPQFQNMYIKDPSRNEIYVFDESSNDFILSNRNDEINKLIENRVNDITEFYDVNHNKLNINTQKVMEKFLDKLETECEDINNSNYIDDKRKKIKNILYNGRKQVKNNYKKFRLKLKKCD
jgi:hypothetical protein